MNISTQTYWRRTQRPTAMLARITLIGLLLAIILFAVIQAFPLPTFVPYQFWSGYALLAGVAALFTLHLRKMLPSLPLGKVSTWLKVHLFVSYFVVALFAFHVGWRVPRGFVEGSLFALFIIVSGSGIYGLFITRVIPRQLSSLSEEFIYERLGAIRSEIAKEAREIVLHAAQDSTVLCDIYHERLAAFLERPRGMWYYLYPTRIRRHALMAELTDARRYMNEERRLDADRLAGLLRRKDELDYHAALQGRLKLWLFLHIGFSYSLLMVALLHTWIVHAYHGGGR